jgi:hypothetical protein
MLKKVPYRGSTGGKVPMQYRPAKKMVFHHQNLNTSDFLKLSISAFSPTDCSMPFYSTGKMPEYSKNKMQ